jgi:hypothetical protein
MDLHRNLNDRLHNTYFNRQSNIYKYKGTSNSQVSTYLGLRNAEILKNSPLTSTPPPIKLKFDISIYLHLLNLNNSTKQANHLNPFDKYQIHSENIEMGSNHFPTQKSNFSNKTIIIHMIANIISKFERNPSKVASKSTCPETQNPKYYNRTHPPWKLTIIIIGELLLHLWLRKKKREAQGAYREKRKNSPKRVSTFQTLVFNPIK